jgi:phospholipase/carboxylesterase
VSGEAEMELAGLRVVSIGDRDAARVVCVLAHGFQMVPADLTPFARSLGVPAWFLFPEGPVPAEPRGRSFWHIDMAAREESLANGPRDFATHFPPGLPAARERFARLLEELVPLAKGRPIIAGGFSQGGMLTSDTILRTPRRVAGLALFSASRIAFAEQEPFYASGAARGLRVLVSHGRADDDLAFSAGEGLRDALVAGGAEVTWVPFDGGHEIPLPVWRALKKLLASLAG